MNLLIVAATEQEVSPFLRGVIEKTPAIDLLITGVGMVSTAFKLGEKLSGNSYNAIINIGIAGSFDRSIPLGSVVRVQKDIFSELGAQDGEGFLSIKDMGFGDSEYYENADPFFKYRTVSSLKAVKGITVNRVHGNQKSIDSITSRLYPDVESMEGAAAFYAASMLSIYSLQVRSISNYVEKRNRSNWEIELAIKNLDNWLTEFVDEFISLSSLLKDS